MEQDLYVKLTGEGISRVTSAEIIDRWEDGCLIRAEEALPAATGRTYYVEEGENLVAVSLHLHENSAGPVDYAAQKDRSDIRPLAHFVHASAR